MSEDGEDKAGKPTTPVAAGDTKPAWLAIGLTEQQSAQIAIAHLRKLYAADGDRFAIWLGRVMEWEFVAMVIGQRGEIAFRAGAPPEHSALMDEISDALAKRLQALGAPDIGAERKPEDLS